jgi:hypothetical protein
MTHRLEVKHDESHRNFLMPNKEAVKHFLNFEVTLKYMETQFSALQFLTATTAFDEFFFE